MFAYDFAISSIENELYDDIKANEFIEDVDTFKDSGDLKTQENFKVILKFKFFIRVVNRNISE